MSQGSEAAEQMTKETLRISETIAKLTGTGAKNLAVFLAAVMKDNVKIKGKTKLNTLLKEGKELKVFPIQEEYLHQFSREAKKYGILYTVIKDTKADPPTFDILARAEDVSKINRVFELIEYPIPGREDEKKTRSPYQQESRSSVRKIGWNTDRASTTERKSVVGDLNKIKKERKVSEKER
ncbi:PcfB family protein [Anaerotignum sp.]|nr:PcfB family protein [Anaerotignum sp.]MBQ7757500.1 PcfB family protein [Anaerotignum sp.]